MDEQIYKLPVGVVGRVKIACGAMAQLGGNGFELHHADGQGAYTSEPHVDWSHHNRAILNERRLARVGSLLCKLLRYSI